jgi:NTE family protein
MTAAASRSPDVLVLGGGGILGEAWMSAVLAGLDEGDGFDSRACGQYIGTSAGSIVAASLVAGIAPGTRLGELPEQPALAPSEDEQHLGALRQTLGAVVSIGNVAAAPLASLALSSSTGGGALLRRAALRRAPRGRRSLERLGREVKRSGVSWDGRLRIAAVEQESGRRVMFGAPGAPTLSVAEAVQASCAIPGVFLPVSAGGRTYVDGGVWSPTNMDAADVRRGNQVLCLNPTGSMRPVAGTLIGALAPISRGVAGAEALALRHRGASVSTINPDDASRAAMGTNLMDPSRRAEVIETGLDQGRRLSVLTPRQAA